jgi:hypothetical protein
VLEFVVKSGVPKSRLSSKGFGSSKPLVERKSEFAYYQNRRVEFIITREARVSAQVPVAPLPQPLGSDGPAPKDEPLKTPAPPPPRPPVPPPPAPPPAAPAPAPASPPAAPKANDVKKGSTP